MFAPNTGYKLINTRPRLVFFSSVILVVFLMAKPSWAEPKPLFELGLGLGGVNQPYYPGSSERRNLLFPAPVPVYRGKVFKSDSRGMRAEVVDEPRYRLEISADINFAIDSDDIRSRRGMDDIDTMFQIGPSFEIDLLEGNHSRVKLNLPLRFNMGISSQRLSDDGFTFSPNISLHQGFAWRDTPWLASLAVGPQFGTQQYHDVYYSVANRFATDERQAYRADGGYSGTRLAMSLRSRNSQRLWVWFLRYDHLDGAEFEASPLVDSSHGVSVGFIYSRFVYRSKTMVDRD